MVFMRDSVYSIVVKVLIAFIIMSNIMVLSYVFLYPRLVFMVTHWGASEREILLSEGPRDNPNMEHLRGIYELMYFVNDHSSEDSVVYFINPQFSKSEAYKILLSRKIQYLDEQDVDEFSLPDQSSLKTPSYIVFRREDAPDFCRRDRVIWDESGCGIYELKHIRNLTTH